MPPGSSCSRARVAMTPAAQAASDSEMNLRLVNTRMLLSTRCCYRRNGCRAIDAAAYAAWAFADTCWSGIVEGNGARLTSGTSRLRDAHVRANPPAVIDIASGTQGACVGM